MPKNKKTSEQTRTSGKVSAVRVDHDASGIVFEIAGKGKKGLTKVFQVEAPLLCSMVFASYTTGNKLHVEHVPGTDVIPLSVVALRLGTDSEPAKIREKKGNTKPSIAAEAGSEA